MRWGGVRRDPSVAAGRRPNGSSRSPSHSHPPEPTSHGPYSRRLAAEWKRWFEGADYAVLSKPLFRIPWTSALRSWFRKHYALVSTGPDVDVYRRL
jgi:hypothetical protein